MIDKRLRKELEADERELKRLKKKLTQVERSPRRGIQTWFRLASRNLYVRRQIVDSKASILLKVNVLILSVVLGTVYQQLSDDPQLIYAVVPLVLTNLISIAFAILASKPRMQRGIEMALGAVAACLVNSIALNAPRHGIKLEGLEITVHADVDPSVLFEVKGPGVAHLLHAEDHHRGEGQGRHLGRTTRDGREAGSPFSTPLQRSFRVRATFGGAEPSPQDLVDVTRLETI